MEPEKKHQPYKQAPGVKDADGINDLISNDGPGSAEPEIPNGWQGGIDRSTAKEGQ